ncbi:unnamed protein product [Effrenium voratum]|uniref:C3H1-type domain-containing protein n=1 Tax=Effrenium voratum TaxID=2562239 RepID=A0AA36JCA3_9DINO|nr:unnamed protein product [Effrenium voratum]CAJ1432196.1 unnamed protein product [Effrenium voratum]
MDDDRALDFELAEKATFLEYLPVCRIRRSASCPGRLKQDGSTENPLLESSIGWNLPHDVSEGCEAWSRSETVSTCSQHSEVAESTPHGREPEWSVGSTLHPQRCKPCAWFWRPAGCARGACCQHCHACLPGEMVMRRRQKRVLVKSIRKLVKETPLAALPAQLCLPAAVPRLPW